MESEMILRLILTGFGIGTLLTAVLALARHRMKETLCLAWGIFAFLLIFSGIVLRPVAWNMYLSYTGLVLAVLAAVCLLIIAYFISAGISELLGRMREAAIQISLLRLENELLKKDSGRQEKMELLLLIPAFNEADNIGELLKQLKKADIRKFADILVIDDGSTDTTREAVESMDCLCVSSLFNQGYGSALQTGYKYAVSKGYSYVIQLDADGQHDICNIESLYRELKRADGRGIYPDIVLGSRFLPESPLFPISGIKTFGIGLFRLLIRLAAGVTIMDPTTGLQGLNARTVYVYSQYGCFDDGYPDANIIMQMLFRGYQIREIPALMHPRINGKSMHSGIKPAIYMFRMAFSVSAVYIREKIMRKDCVQK